MDFHDINIAFQLPPSIFTYVICAYKSKYDLGCFVVAHSLTFAHSKLDAECAAFSFCFANFDLASVNDDRVQHSLTTTDLHTIELFALASVCSLRCDQAHVSSIYTNLSFKAIRSVQRTTKKKID